VLHNETGKLKGTSWYSEDEFHTYCMESKVNQESPQFPFHDCLQCNSYIKARLKGKIEDDSIVNWLKRVKKYAIRFDQFEFIYITADLKEKKISTFDIAL
jgi:hypothetical protein